MGRKPIRSPKNQTFLNVLDGDFSEFLSIPPAFVKNFNGKSLGKCALRGPNGTWNVELEKRENGLFFHDRGWQGFVKDHVLEEGDFLVFSYDGESNFNVTVYDNRTFCEKNVEAAKRRSTDSLVSLANKGKQARVEVQIVDFETENDNENSEREMTISDKTSSRVDFETQSDKEDSENETIIADKTSRKEEGSSKGYVDEISIGCIVFKSENSCFMKTFKKHLQYRVMIPKKIAVDEGHMNKKSAIVEDPYGRSWPVRLISAGKSGSKRLIMTKGWTQCCKMNQISPGDTIIFECVKQGVIQIHIFKAGDKRCPVGLVAAAP